jgi:uncharacterized membrane protein (UPF0127 family)
MAAVTPLIADARQARPLRSVARAARAFPFFFLLFFIVLPAMAGGDSERLVAETATGAHVFRIELARTPRERAKGLMFRRELAADAGMLFDFQREETIAMWMKNTYVSLDMIFLSRQGKVVSIAADATPLSEAVISSGQPAYAVLEVPAGTAHRIGAAVGDLFRHPIFKP